MGLGKKDDSAVVKCYPGVTVARHVADSSEQRAKSEVTRLSRRGKYLTSGHSLSQQRGPSQRLPSTPCKKPGQPLAAYRCRCWGVFLP